MTYSCDVSIIVSVLHPELSYLREVILSAKRLVEKSALSVELLLGNDGSPVEDRPVFEECAALAPELVKLFHFDVNRGIGRARSVLIKHSGGRYIMPFDGDDILLPFELDKEIAFLDANPEYSASYAEKILFNRSGLTGEIHGNDYSDFLAYFQPKVNINAMLIRREALLACNSFVPVPESRINEDVYLIMRLFRYGKIAFARTPRALYRKHAASICALYGGEQDDFRYMARAMAERDPDLLYSYLSFKMPHVSEERKRISAAVAGSTLFLYQKNQFFARRLLEACVEAFPDDYGTWEMHLFFERNFLPPERFFSRCRMAIDRFREYPGKVIAIGENAFIFMKRGIPIPGDIREIYRESYRKKYAALNEVRHLVPGAEPHKVTYSFRNPVLKI